MLTLERGRLAALSRAGGLDGAGLRGACTRCSACRHGDDADGAARRRPAPRRRSTARRCASAAEIAAGERSRDRPARGGAHRAPGSPSPSARGRWLRRLCRRLSHRRGRRPRTHLITKKAATSRPEAATALACRGRARRRDAVARCGACALLAGDGGAGAARRRAPRRIRGAQGAACAARLRRSHPEDPRSAAPAGRRAPGCCSSSTAASTTS